MREVATGLWHWEAPHAQWRSTEPWGPEVSSYAIDDGERLLLFDPLAVPSNIEELAEDRERAIVLTNPWHERDSRDLVERLGLPVYTPLPDTAEYLMEKWGLTAEQVGDGSPMSSGSSRRESAKRARTQRATDWTLVLKRFLDKSRTTWCSGSRAIARSSPATRSSTSVTGSRSIRGGWART